MSKSFKLSGVFKPVMLSMCVLLKNAIQKKIPKQPCPCQSDKFCLKKCSLAHHLGVWRETVMFSDLKKIIILFSFVKYY